MPVRHYTRKQLLALLAIRKGKWLSPKEQPLFLDLSKSASKQFKKMFPRHDKAVTIVEPLNNVATYPILITWSLVLLVQFSLATLAALSIIALLLTVPLGLIAYKKIQKDRVKTQKTSIDTLALIQLKLKMIHCYITKPSYLALLSQDNPSCCCSDYAHQSIKKHRIDYVYAGIEICVYSTYTLFATYYLGINSLLYFCSNLAFVAALMSPVGLFVGLGVSILAGIYFGFNQYQASREEGYCKARIRELNKQLTADEKIFKLYLKHVPSKDQHEASEKNTPSQSTESRLKFRTHHPAAYQIPHFFARAPSQGKLNFPLVSPMLNQ